MFNYEPFGLLRKECLTDPGEKTIQSQISMHGIYSQPLRLLVVVEGGSNAHFPLYHETPPVMLMDTHPLGQPAIVTGYYIRWVPVGHKVKYYPAQFSTSQKHYDARSDAHGSHQIQPSKLANSHKPSQ